MPGTKIWTRCSICLELDGNGKIFSEEIKINDNTCFVNSTRNYPQFSTSSKMSHNSSPIFVYQRRKQRKNPAAVFNLQSCDGTKPSGPCPFTICSEPPSLSFNCSAEETGSEEPFTVYVNRTLNAEDNCSSSKSNLGLSTAALKIDSNDASDCSSSGALISVPPEIIILILRTQGLIDEVSNRRDVASTQSNGVSRKKYCSKSCKVCGHMDSTSNLLICDNCEDAFHVSCYNPHIARIPVNEWLCSSCSKKKREILSNVVHMSTETGRSQYLAPELDTGLELMFRDTEPYMSNVRIGDDFQAVVPDWHGPVNEECDLNGEPLETNPSDNIKMQERSIGNWIQCREVIGEGVHEKICGKWRRAPLYEVQTDKWECFSCVLWDPVHADCAVPQELPTDEVMKQLKYVEMLRPRIAAKRRKLDSSKSNGPRDVSCGVGEEMPQRIGRC